MEQLPEMPLPGVRVAAVEEQAIIVGFRLKYRVYGPGGFVAHTGYLADPRRPTWAMFPPAVIRLKPADLEMVDLPTTEELLLYVEYPRPGVLHKATWQAIRQYLVAQ